MLSWRWPCQLLRFPASCAFVRFLIFQLLLFVSVWNLSSLRCSQTERGNVLTYIDMRYIKLSVWWRMTSETLTSNVFDPSQRFPSKHKVEQLVANQLPAAELRWRSLPRGRNSPPKKSQSIVPIVPVNPFNTWSHVLLKAFAKYCEFGIWISDLILLQGRK